MIRLRRHLVGFIIGGLLGITVLAVGVVRASVQSTEPHPEGLIPQLEGPRLRDVLHSPPLLVSRGESVELVYTAICGPDASGERCRPRGSVYVQILPRNGSGYVEIPLVGGWWPRPEILTATVPASYTQEEGFNYYTVIDDRRGESRTLPNGGAAAPQRAQTVDNWITVGLGTHQFGNTRTPDRTELTAAWGDGGAELGLNERVRFGPAAFDLAADRSPIVLDQVNRRFAIYPRTPSTAAWFGSGGGANSGVIHVPIPFVGGEGDIAVGRDNVIYLLQHAGGDKLSPAITAYGRGGDIITVSPLAAPRADMIRIGPLGPLVHVYPLDMWIPAIGLSCQLCPHVPISPDQQIVLARPARTIDGGEIIVRAYPSEIRLALVNATGVVTRAWRITSTTSLGGVYLAEPSEDSSLVVVTKLWTEDQAEYLALRLTTDGLAERFTLDAAEWAEMSTLGRFRKSGDRLYQMRSSPSGAQLVSFTIGAH